MNISASKKQACTIFLVLAALLFTFQSRAGIFVDAPDAIVCNVPEGNSLNLSGDVVFYLDARFDNGTVLYNTLSQQTLQLSVNPDGMVTSDVIKQCDGKTLDELEKEGRALHLHSGKAL